MRKLPPGNTNSLEGLKQMGAAAAGNHVRAKNKSKIREMAIRESAMTIGAQSALAARAQQINDILQRHNRDLERTFNFQALLLKDNVIPPVLGRGDNTLDLNDPLTIRISDRTYKIEEQAQFVTTAPNWREYLIMDYEVPKRPYETMLPRDLTEKKIWDNYVTKGWNNGVKQADAIFTDNLARMTHQFKGMLIYRNLLAQGMVSAPFVSKTEMGVTGDEENLRINDKVLRIAALPTMQLDAQNWKPAVTEREMKLTETLIEGWMPGKEPMEKPIVIKQNEEEDF